MSNIKGKINEEQLDPKLLEKFKSSLEEILTDDKRLTNAKDITGAINEVFTNADNGKKSISNTIGSPLSASDSFDDMKSKIQTLKNTMASNLSSKLSQSCNGNESLNNLINKVSNINTGKKWASGFATEKSYSAGRYEVSGLDFKPSLIIAWTDSSYAVYSSFDSISIDAVFSSYSNSYNEPFKGSSFNGGFSGWMGRKFNFIAYE